MTGENAAPAEMPGVEEIARAIRGARLRALNAPPIYVMFNDDAPAEDADLASARAILALLAPILAEKERAERERCAKIADDTADNDSRGDSPYDNGAGSCGYRKACYDIAAAIRAQGDTAQQDSAG